MSSLLALMGTGVKSIQHGAIAITSGSGTATITAVDTSKSVIIPAGSYHSLSNLSGGGALEFASSTSITATWAGTGGVVRYTVVEYF